MCHSTCWDWCGSCSMWHPRGIGRDMQLSYANLSCKTTNLAQDRNPDKHSLEVVCILKRATDTKDNYQIYKINNSQFNGGPDYMFKPSHTMAQIVFDINQEGPENPLWSEEAYFDGSHSWCIGYKTLALFCIIQACRAFLELLWWK